MLLFLAHKEPSAARNRRRTTRAWPKNFSPPNTKRHKVHPVGVRGILQSLDRRLQFFLGEAGATVAFVDSVARPFGRLSFSFFSGVSYGCNCQLSHGSGWRSIAVWVVCNLTLCVNITFMENYFPRCLCVCVCVRNKNCGVNAQPWPP